MSTFFPTSSPSYRQINMILKALGSFGERQCAPADSMAAVLHDALKNDSVCDIANMPDMVMELFTAKRSGREPDEERTQDDDPNVPLLRDKIPWATLPDMDYVRKLLEKTLQGQYSDEDISPSTPLTKEFDDSDRCFPRTFIDANEDLKIKAKGYVRALPVPELEDLRIDLPRSKKPTTHKTKEPCYIGRVTRNQRHTCIHNKKFDMPNLPSDTLRTGPMCATILPTRFSPGPQHFEASTSTVLLCGKLAWLIYPPTQSNLALLHTYYKRAASDRDDGQYAVRLPSRLDVCMGQMRGGITCLQHPGQTLSIPPFCSTVCVAIETSCLVQWEVVMARGFVQRCMNLPMSVDLRALARTPRLDIALKDLTKTLHFDLLRILLCEFEDYDIHALSYRIVHAHESPLKWLLTNWDANVEKIVDVFEEAEGDVVGIRRAMEAELVLGLREKFRCLLCGKRILAEVDRRYARVEQHFRRRHWVGKRMSGGDEKVD